MKRLLAIGLALLLTTAARAEVPRVISYGNDLSAAEKTAIAKELPIPADVKLEQIKTVTVTNEEEWSLLRGLVPDAQIGTKAVSSVYIEKLTAGAGIQVDIKNINFITPHIYANSLVTAGVSDARVYATAPAPVSGTAALVGIFKSFEELTGKKLSATAQRTAAEELIATGNLGEKIGKERAAVLVERTKERVVEQKANTKEEVSKIVEQSAKEQNLSLSDEEKGQLTDLMLKVKQLNIDINQLRGQLKNFSRDVKEELPPEAPKSLLSQLIEFFRSLFNRVFSFVGRIFGNA